MPNLPPPALPARARLRLCIRGAVQGVGFRPFVYRLARRADLAGWISNAPEGVFLELEGARSDLEKCRATIEQDKPAHSIIQSVESAWLAPAGYTTFQIRPSESAGSLGALVLPDLAACPDCVRDIFDPANRRHRYPFTNCTHCGPRFTIIERMPYDREHTTMKAFPMCSECQAEYADPANRRFHAQPNACPKCGPSLSFWRRGRMTERAANALLAAAEALREGLIVAVQGVGGFHLMTDARNAPGVLALRRRKHREAKPFAMLFPDLAAVQEHCAVTALEERLLLSPEAPIVLLQRRRSAQHAFTGVAPGNPNLGVMLPSNPLHHLLMSELKFPVVATSGNLSDEPICTAADEALDRLCSVADVFLTHNRPIVRHVDDSIVQVVEDRPMLLRRARGYAPLPINVGHNGETVLAFGSHLKNSVALAHGTQVFISQHIGDLETERARSAFASAVDHLQKLHPFKPSRFAADLHPDCHATRHANDSAAGPVTAVQHHIAHVLACVAEHRMPGPALGVAWDGTGFGEDASVWGGEFFRVADDEITRVGHLRTFRLPGGDAAAREPRRAALGLLFELFGGAAFDLKTRSFEAFSHLELRILASMLRNGTNSPRCSSMGRLFDGVASLVGLRQRSSFEGQAAMDLEFAFEAAGGSYAFEIRRESGLWVVDWGPAIQSILTDTANCLKPSAISAKFHHGLAECIAEMARRCSLRSVALGGGCFQNRRLLELTSSLLRKDGIQVCWPERVPPNDGGIAFGQAIAARRVRGKDPCA